MIFAESLLLIGSSAVHYRFGPMVGRAGQERASDWPIRALWSSFSFRLKVGKIDISSRLVSRSLYRRHTLSILPSTIA